MGRSSGVLFKEVSAFWRCPLIEVSLYPYIYVLVSCSTTGLHVLIVI